MNSLTSKKLGKKNSDKYTRSRPIGNNIYNSTQFNKVNKYHKTKARQRFKKSLNPTKTNIISSNNKHLLDSDSVFSDDTRSHHSTKNIVEHMDLVKNSETMAKLKPNMNNGSFKDQFNTLSFDNTGAPASFNNVSQNTSANNRSLIERGIMANGGFSKFDSTPMNYNVTNDMNHTNKLPFFNSTDYGLNKSSQNVLNRQNQRKMELFTGNLDSVDHRPKTERKPLFNPIVGLTNIHGSPVQTDVLKTRYIPSRERKNELPFQPEKVTPGLGLGANEQGRHGRHDLTRIMRPNIDQLRIATNQKQEYKFPIVQGKRNGEKRQQQSEVIQRRPMTFKENKQDDMQKNMSYIKAPKTRDNYNLKETNRKATISYAGPKHATVEKSIPENMKSRVQESSKYERETKALGIVGTHHMNKNKSYNPKDTPRFTLKENFINQTRPGNVGTHERTKGKAYNPNDIPDVTLKDILSHAQRLGNINNSQLRNSRQRLNKNDIPNITLKELLINMNRVGMINASHLNKSKAFNPNDIPDITLKDMLVEYNRVGNVYNKSLNRQKYNHMDAPDVTLKEILLNVTRIGNINNSQFNKGGYVYESQVADAPTTLRQTTQHTIYRNPAEGSRLGAHGIMQQGLDPKVTLRQNTQYNNYINGINTSQFSQGGHGITQQGLDPRTTMRQFTENNTYINPMEGNKQGGHGVTQQGMDAKTTLRQYTQHNTHSNPIGTSHTAQGGHDIEQQGMDVKTTMRQHTQHNTHRNPIGTSHTAQGGHDIEQQGMNVKTTMRQHTQHNTHRNPIGTSHTSQGAHSITQQGMDAKVTMRQTTENNKYINPATGKSKQRRRQDMNNARVNIIKEKVAAGRKPTKINVNVGPVSDYTSYRIKEPIQQCRTIMPARDKPSTVNRVPLNNTRKVENFNFGGRNIEDYVLSGLTTNKYVNNTQHQAIF